MATFDVSMASPDPSAFQIAGDCVILPTVAIAVEDKVIKATLADGSCSDGKSLTVTVDPKDFSSLLGVSGAGDAVTKEFSIKTSGPSLSLSSPTKTLLNSSATSSLALSLTASSSGGTTLTDVLSESGAGITLTRVSGNPTCTVGASSLSITGATISLSNCSGNGTFTLHVDPAVAKDSLENTFAHSAESAEITVDTIAPTLSSSKLTETSLGASSLGLSWTAATDEKSTNLSYSVYKSAANPSAGSFASVVNAKGGTLVTSGTNLSAATISSGLTASSSYYFNVIVADEGGNETAYQGQILFRTALAV